MYGLHFRDEYEEPVARELDSLVARLKALILTEHNEDGTHSFNLPLNPSKNDVRTQHTITQIKEAAQRDGQHWLKGPWLLDDATSASPHKVVLRPPDPATSTTAMAYEVIEYTGNGTGDRAIATTFPLDFGTNCVIILRAGASVGDDCMPVFRVSGSSDNFSGDPSVTSANGIKSFTSSGFTLGTNDQVNKTGDKYTVLVFHADASPSHYIAVGTYTGNGPAGDRQFDIGFGPTLVLIVGDGVSDSYQLRTSLMDPGASISLSGSTDVNAINEFNSTGFEISGVSNTVNSSGIGYCYLAVKLTDDAQDSADMKVFEKDPATVQNDTVALNFTPAFALGRNVVNDPSDSAFWRSTNSHSSTDSQRWDGDRDTGGAGIRALANPITVGSGITGGSAFPVLGEFHGFALASAGEFADESGGGGSATLHNYEPIGLDVCIGVEIESGSNLTITGLKALEGLNQKRLIFVRNRSNSNTVTLVHESASSLATNRFMLPFDEDIELGAQQNLWLYYDLDQQRWTAFLTPHNSGGFSRGLDPAANETISGSWTFSADTTFSSSVFASFLTVGDTVDPPTEIKAHIKKGNAGTDPTWVAGDVALIENTAGTDAWLNFFGTAGQGLVFSDTTRNVGAIFYSHATDSIGLRANASTRAVITSAGQFGLGSGIATTDVPANVMMHIREGNAGTDPTWNVADLLLLESDGAAAVTFFTPNTQSQGLIFSDTDARNSGNIIYNHSTDAMTFRVNAATRLEITSAGLFNVVTDAALGIIDTNANHYLRFDCASDLSADRVLSFAPGDSARTITLSGDPTLADWFDQSVKIAASPVFGGLRINGNVGISTATFGTSAASVLAILNGTAPSTSPADTIQIFSVDDSTLGAGNATLGLYTETAVGVDVALASTHSIRVMINGTSYKLLLAT